MPERSIQRRLDGDPGGSNPSFAQSGQVDWVSLAKSTVSLTVDSLTRLSGAGVQELTYVSALELASQFELAEIGYNRTEEAIQKASYSPAFNGVAYFGFGYRSFLNMLAERSSGVKFIALSACLSEAHSEDVSARVVRALWTTTGLPEDYQPSLMQFKCIVKACAGVFAQTSFPSTVDLMFGGSGPYNLFRSFGSSAKSSSMGPAASDPINISNALQGLFDVSKGRLAHIKVVGGSECAFIAAVAYWLFALKIQVENDDGQLLFTSSESSEDLQVSITYRKLPESQNMVLTRSTFFLGSPEELLHCTPQHSQRLVRCRVPWKSCLRRTYGLGIEKLLELPSVLGKLLGGLARVYQAIAKGESTVRDYNRETFINFVEGSYGYDMIQNMAAVLPELDCGDLRSIAFTELSNSVGQAHSSVEEALQILKERCRCTMVVPRAARNIEQPRCLLTLAVTVVRLVTLLTSTDYSKDLQPTQLGLMHIFEQSSEASELHNKLPKISESARIAIMTSLGIGVGDDTEPGSFSKFAPLAFMTDNIFLFAGEEPVGNSRNLEARTAIAINGICVYLDCLQGLGVRPELLRKLHVIPGYIGRGNKIFNSIWDSATGIEQVWEDAILERAIEPESLLQDHDATEPLTLVPLVDEPSDGMGKLMFYYQVSTPHARLILPPGRITENVLRSSGIITCPGVRESCNRPFLPNIHLVRSGWEISAQNLPSEETGVESNSIDVVVWNPRASELYRLTAFHYQSFRSTSTRFPSLFLRQDQCLSCSTRSAFTRVSLALNQLERQALPGTRKVANVF